MTPQHACSRAGSVLRLMSDSLESINESLKLSFSVRHLVTEGFQHVKSLLLAEGAVLHERP